MNDLELRKPHEEIKTFDQHREAATHGFVTSNPKMLRIIDIAGRVAQTDGTKSVQNVESWFLSLYSSPIDFNTKSAIRFISSRVAPFTAWTARPYMTTQ